MITNQSTSKIYSVFFQLLNKILSQSIHNFLNNAADKKANIKT